MHLAPRVLKDLMEPLACQDLKDPLVRLVSLVLLDSWEK